MSRPLVACVVLNTNRREDTLACLASIAASTYPNLRVIVLDCQSTDGSVGGGPRTLPGRRNSSSSTENRGYAGNNNVGIRRAMELGAEWVFVLNEDTVLDPTCIEEMMEVAGRDPRIGMVGPMVYHHDEPDVIQSAGGGLTRWWEGFHWGQNETDRGQFAAPRDVRVDLRMRDCSSGARSIAQVGVIDERFFIYWEETEWCVRAGRAGWRLVHVPAARIWHKGVQRDYRPKPSVTYYSTRNRLLMLSMQRAPLTARVVAWAQILRTLTSWSVRPKWRHKRDHRDAMWRGVADFVRGHTGRMPA